MQKLARFLACSAVLATVVLSAPGTVLAAPGKTGPTDRIAKPDGTWTSGHNVTQGNTDHIGGEVKPDRTWTSVKNKKYEKTQSNSNKVKYESLNNVDGGLCMQLYEFHSNTPLTGEECTEENQIELAPVPPGTDFFPNVKKRGVGSDNVWDGMITY